MILAVRSRPSVLAAVAALALAAAPALAQTPGEPAHPSTDVATAAPVPVAPAPPTAQSNPQVDQTGLSQDGPPDGADLAYEARIRQSVAAAESYQGPMDGRWTLYGDDGKPLYVFMFVDPVGGRGELEAAWRDPRRVRGGDDLGVVDMVGRTGPSLTLSFVPRQGAPVTRIELQSGSDGGFAGRMDEAGAVRTVKLRRD